MKSLPDHIRELLFVLEGRGLTPPVQEVRVIEISANHPLSEGRFLLSRRDIRTAADFSSRFEELAHSGLPWINVTCYGVYKGLLLVGIETPQRSGRSPSTGPIAINYSGPPTRVIQNGWDAGEILMIE